MGRIATSGGNTIFGGQKLSNYRKIFLFIVALAIAAAYICYQKPLSKGLDIAGGMRVVLKVDPKDASDWPTQPMARSEKMNSIRTTIENRVKGLGGVTEPMVQIQNATKDIVKGDGEGGPRVVVELPGVKDPDKALDKIKGTASLEFYYLKDVKSPRNKLGVWSMDIDPSAEGKGYIFNGPAGETYHSTDPAEAKLILEKVVNTAENKPILTGKDIEATAKTNVNQSNQIVINLQFNKEGTKKFGAFTKAHKNEYLAIFFDGKLLTAPEVRDAIMNGQAEVSGFESLTEAREIADYLNSGALPVPLTPIAKDTVEPTVGGDTFKEVVFAGIIGLILVLLFMAIYYRLPGIIADVALALYTLFVIAIFKAIGASISLAGVAALIISIGMAVDANVLIFERLKEELNAGKTLRNAIESGFARAFTAIFDSNMCSIITCLILLWYGTSSVQSFATTLLIGVLVSMFTAITVTRTFLMLLVKAEWAQKPGLYGLGRSWIAKSGKTFDFVSKPWIYFLISAVLILPGMYFLATGGLKPSIEFKSGTTVQARFAQPVELQAVRDVVAKHAGDKGYTVQLADGGKVAFIKTASLGEAEDKAMQKDLDDNFTLKNKSDQHQYESVNNVGPTISKELTRNALISVIIASCLIIIYITFRFAIGGVAQGFKYGVCAVLALIHDVLFILGLFAILGKFFNWEVDSLFVTAILTIVGFSVHDTIVIFDRIRENLRRRLRGETFAALINRSLLETFSRSINTTVTVLVTLLALVFWGGKLLMGFYVAMLAGTIIGSYSSLFIAAQLVDLWNKWATGEKLVVKNDFEEKAMVDVSAAAKEVASEVKEEAEEAVKKVKKAAKNASGRIKKTKKRF